ncbi:hypothetical protein Tco_0122504 [Tanacetum coccineum]
MSMTIQSSVKDKILATSSKTSKVENTPAEMLRDLDQQMEKRADDAIQEISDVELARILLLMSIARNEILVTINYGLRKDDLPRGLASLQKVLGRDWDLSTAWLSRVVDGQSKRMIQNLEDIMRARVIDFGGSYHLSIRCAPFEA